MNENDEPDSRRQEQMEASLTEVKARLDRIERQLGLQIAATAAAPPPILGIHGLGPRIVQPEESHRAPIETMTPPVAPPRFDYPAAIAHADEDAELKFGSVVLPRAGAGIALLGIGYLVAMSIQRGWITPWMQFWGAIALCLLSVGIGFWKRKEGSDFGQVMIGLGSCGLYLTFAAGHVFQNLYSGEMLVNAYLFLSLANLLYGGFTPSKTFTAIGLLGGVIASLLPMDRHQVVVSLWLHAVILVPTAVIIARHKWRQMALGAWIVSTSALLWPVLERGPWPLQLGILYGSSLVLLSAYAWTHEGWEFDPKATFIPVAAVLTGMMGFVVGKTSGPGTTYHEVFFGLALALASMTPKRPESRNALLLAGVLAPFVWAPLGLASLGDAWTYIALAAISAVVSMRYFAKTAASLSALGLGLGLMMYASRFSGVPNPISAPEETLFLLSAIGVIVLASVSAISWYKNVQTVTFLASLLVSPLISRTSAVLMGQPAVGASVLVAVLASALAMSAAAAFISIYKRWVLLSVFAWLAVIASFVAYLSALEFSPLSFGVEWPILACMLIVIYLCGGASGKAMKSSDGAGVVAGFAGWGVFTRLVYLIATSNGNGISGSASITLAWIIYASALIIAGFLLDMRSLRLTSLSIFGLTVGKVLLVDLAELDPAIRVILLILLGSAMIAGGYWYIRRIGTSDHPPTSKAAS